MRYKIVVESASVTSVVRRDSISEVGQYLTTWQENTVRDVRISLEDARDYVRLNFRGGFELHLNKGLIANVSSPLNFIRCSSSSYGWYCEVKELKDYLQKGEGLNLVLADLSSEDLLNVIKIRSLLEEYDNGSL